MRWGCHSAWRTSSTTFIWRFKFPDKKLSEQVGACLPRGGHRRGEPELRAGAVARRARGSGEATTDRTGLVCRRAFERRRRLPAAGDVACRTRLDDEPGGNAWRQVRSGTPYAYHGAADVNDKRYDSRAGLGVFYRWKPRNVQALCRDYRVLPKVHRSVFERLARNTEGYAPGSLPTELEVISTTVPPTVLDSIAATVKSAFAGRPPLLEQRRAWRVIGVTGYVLLIAAVSVLLALIFATFISDARATGAGWQATVLAVANTAISSHWINVIVRTAWHHPLARRARRRIPRPPVVGGPPARRVLLAVLARRAPETARGAVGADRGATIPRRDVGCGTPQRRGS